MHFALPARGLLKFIQVNLFSQKLSNDEIQLEKLFFRTVEKVSEARDTY